MWSAALIASAVIAGISSLLQPPADGRDFAGLYVAACLDGKHLYDQQAQAREFERIQARKVFYRPAYYALALKPFSLLPYRTALIVWWVLGTVALASAVGLIARSLDDIMRVALFLPVSFCLALGQDDTLLLLVFAGGVTLLAAGRPVTAGAVFALLSIKPNLFWLLPLVMVIRARRCFVGFIGAGAALYLVSAMYSGWDWILQAIRLSGANDAVHLTRYASLWGLFQPLGAPWNWVLAIGASALLLLILAPTILRGSEKTAFAAALFASLATGHHVIPFYDAMLVLPFVMDVELSFPLTFLIGLCGTFPFPPSQVLLYGVPLSWKGRTRNVSLASPLHRSSVADTSK